MPSRSAAKTRVQQQFGRQARCYARSKVHAKGTSLPVLLRLGNPRPHQLVLDVATGTGFTAFAFAPRVHKVVASDLTMRMLAQARSLCRELRLTNISFQLAEAEELPYRADAFDIATCRIAPHHFADVHAFLREMWRVLRPGGTLLVADTASPAAGEVQNWHNRVERLRDPSHLWSYTPAQWRALVEEAGFQVEVVHTRCRTPMVFSEWVKVSGTPDEVVEELRSLFACASEPVRRAFRILPTRDDFRFSWSVAIIRGRKMPPDRLAERERRQISS